MTLRTDDYPFYLKESTYYDLKLEPYFAMKDFRAEEDADDPSIVHYSCRIPGVVAVCFNMAYGVCFQDIDQYSKWVPVEGDVHVIVTDDGSRRIDFTREDNVFTLFWSLRHFDPRYFKNRGMDPPKGRLRNSDFSEGMNILLTQASIFYASLLGVETEDYIDQTVVPELSEVNDHIKKISKNSVKTQHMRTIMKL